MDRRRDLVALSLLRLGSDTLAPRRFHQILWPHLGDPPSIDHIVEDLAALLPGSPEDQGPAVTLARLSAAAALDRARAAGLRFISVVDAEYPDWLRYIPDPPLGLWHLATAPLDPGPAVAIVGSRQAQPASLMMARRLARGLAGAGLIVVSGLARGVDEAAHRGALEAGGPTLAVLGSGLDRIYPSEHRSLAATIAGHGAVLSEYPPGTPPLPRHFPLRNRIISGLCRAVVVVEASDKSGSLITARAALEQGRDVMAVPGTVLSGCHRGCHALIKDGARLVETVEDVLEELRWNRLTTSPETVASAPPAEPAHPLWAVMPVGEPVSVDDLAGKTGRSAADLLGDLGQLEVAGQVIRAPGGAFLRVD